MNHSEQGVQVELREEYIETPEPGITDPILSLQGLGKDIWKDEDTDAYIRRIRTGWQ